MAKQLKVDLTVNANTAEAKARFQDLQKSLHQVATSLQQAGDAKINVANLREAAGAAQELQRHLINAVNTNTGKLDLNKFNTSLKKSNADISQLSSRLLSAGATGQQAFIKLTQSIAAADRPVITLSTHLNGFLTTLKNTARWQISSSILHGLIGALQGAYGYAQDLNESLNKIRIVTGYSVDRMADFAVEANKAAKALSTTTTEYTKASLIYYQQGLSDKDVKARTDATIKLANVSGQTAEEVSDQLTAVWNNFAEGSDNLEHYIDIMAKLGATTASSTKEISTGLEKFAAVAKTVGLSYDYATSALATITATTRQSADIVGTALKTLFARIQDLEVGKTLEDGTTLGKYSKALSAVGVNIKDINGEVKDMDDILDELGEKWKTIAKDQQIALAQTVAGTRQYTQLIALMDNWDFMQKNLATAATSQGTLDQQAKIYEESWEASSKRVKASLQGIYDDLIDDKFFIKLNNGIASILNGIDSFIKDFGGLKNLVLGFGGILITYLSDKIKPAAEAVKMSLVTMFQTPKQQAEQYKDTLDKIVAAGEQELGLNFANTDKSTQVALENARGLATAKNQLMIVDKSLTTQERQLAQQQLDMIMSQQDYVQSLADAVVEQQKFCDNIESVEPKIQLSTAALKEQEETLSRLTEEYEEWVMLQEEYSDGSIGSSEAAANASAAESALDMYIDTLEMAEGTAQALGDTLMDAFSAAAQAGENLDTLTVDVTGSFAEFNTILDRSISEIDQLGASSTTTQADIEHAMAGSQASLKVIYNQMLHLGILTKDQRKLFVQAFATKDSKKYNDLLNKIKASMSKITIEGKKVQSTLGKLGKGKEVAQTVKGFENLHKAQKQCEEEQERLNKAIANFDPKHVMGGGEAFLKLAGAGMQASMAINGLRSAWEAITSSDMSAGERITQILMGVGMAAPAAAGAIKSLLSVSQALQSSFQAITIATTAYNAAQTALTAGTEAATAAEKLNELAKKGANDEILKAAANKVAEALASEGVIAADQTEALSSKLVTSAKAAEGAMTADIIAEDAAEVASKGAVTGAKAAATAGTWAHVVALIAEKLAMAPLLVIVLLLTAALGALALIVWGIVSAVKAFIANSPEGKLKAAAKRAEELAKALDDAKEAADNLKQAFSSYTTVANKLAECTKGTEAWYEALGEVNSQVVDLMNKYPELAAMTKEVNGKIESAIYKDENGALAVREWAQEDLTSLYNDRVIAAQGASFQAQTDVREAQINVDKSNLRSKLYQNSGTMYDENGYDRSYDMSRLIANNTQEIFNKQTEGKDLTTAIAELLNENGYQGDRFAGEFAKVINDNGLIDAMNELTSEITANSTAIDAQNQAMATQIISNNEKLQGSDYAKDINQASGRLYGIEYDAAYEQHLANAKKRGLFNTKTDAAEKEWKAYVEKAGLTGKIDKVTNYKGDGSIEYKDKEGNKKTVSAEEIAATLAAADAANKLAGSCETLAETFSRLDNSTDQADHALKDFLTSGNLESSSKVEFDQISKKDAKTYLGEQFGGEDKKLSDEEAKALGYETAEAMTKAYEQAISRAQEMWANVDFGKIAVNGVAQASLETATNLQSAFDNISLGPEGESVGKDFVSHLNKMLEGVDTTQQQEALERLAKIDWSSYDAMEDAKSIMADYGKEIDLTDSYWQKFIADMRIATGAQPDFSTLKQDLAKTTKIIDKLDFGSVISDEDYQKLIDYKDAFKELFMMQADGTRKFIGKKEDMTQVVREDIEAKRSQFQERADTTQAFKNANWHWADGDKKGQTIDFSTVSGANTTLAGNILDAVKTEGANSPTGQFMNMLGYDAESIQQIIEQASSSSEDIAKIGQARLLEMYQRMGEAQHEGLTEMSEEFNEMMASTATSYEDLGKMLADGLTSPEAAAKQLDFLATSAINASTSLDELDVAIVKAQEAGATIDYDTYANQLVNLASQYDNTSFEVARYQEALERAKTEGGAQAEAALGEAEANLRAATAAGEAAKKYGLTAGQIERYAEELKNSGKYEKASKRELVELAKDQLRYDKAVVSAQKNMSKWTKDLKVAAETGHLVAETADEMAEAYGDLLDIDGSELSAEFLSNADNLELMEKALNGDEEAYRALQDAVRADIEARFGINDEEFQTKYADLFAKIDDIRNNGDIEVGASIDDQGFLDSLSEMVNAAGMTAQEATDYLSSMGIDAEVVNEPEQVEETVGYNLTPIVTPRTGSYGPAAGGGESTYSYPQVRYLSTPVTETKTVDGTALKVTSAAKSSGGNVKHSGSTPANGGSNKGSGGGGGGKQKSAASHEHNVNRYSNEENVSNGLAKIYDRISEAKDHAFGAERINLMQKELTTLGKLKDAAAGYLAAIVGQGNVDKIVKAVYSGKNIGDMIKSGELGGTIAADFKSLFSGLDAAGKQLEYQVKDAAGNTSLKEEGYDLNAIQALFGESLNIELDSYGNIKNRDDIMNMLDRWNNGVEDWFSGISDTATEADENEKARRLAMIEAIRERIEQYGETAELIQDKVDEYLEQIYEMQQKNADIIAGKLEKQIRLTENELALLQNSIKLMGKNMYKTQKGMEDWFAAVWTTPVEEREKSAQAAKTAGEEAMAAWHKWQADEFNTEGINSEQALDIIASSRDAIQEAFDGIFEGIDEMSEHMGNTLDYWNDKIDKVTSAMEANASTLEHLQNVLGLLGRSADYKALGEILKGQLSVAEDQYTGAKTKAESSVSAYKQAYEEYKKLLAEDKQEAEWFKENTLDALQAQMIEDVAAKQAALENVLEKVNAWFENEINRIYQESEDRLTGEWGSFDELDAAMQRQHNLADEYLTKTNQLYETGTLLRKLAQDIDKTDSAAAKAKLKAFSDEIELMKEQEQLNKTDLEIAKARYELLLAEIALEEAQNAKSTVRLQRDSEGNYGYVYTADQDKVADAEQNLADKQNDLYNLVLGQTQDYNEKIIQHTKERNEALADLDRKWLNGEITDEEEYHRIRQDITEKYNDLLEADYHSYYEAVKWLNLVGAEGQTEAWTNSFSNILYSQDTYAQKLEAESDNISSEIDKDMEWLNSQRDYYTEEAKVGNEELKDTIDEVTDANKALLEQLIGKDGKSGLVGGMSSATSAAINLTSAFASQYTQALETAKGYQEMLQALQAYEREILNFEGHNTGGDEGGGKSYTAYSKDGAQYTIGSERGIDFVENAKAGDTITGGDGSTWVKNSDGSVLISKNGVEYLYGASWPGEPAAPTVQQPTQPATPSLEKGQSVTVKTTATNFTRDGGYGTRMQSWVPGYTFTVMGVSGDEVLIGLNGQVTGWVRKSDLVGFRSGGYTGEFGNDGKLAMLHEKELVLNAADTENLLDAITIIREISSAIDLRAAAANMAATLASPGYGTQAQEIQQTVTIHAEFPNATDHTEIEEAFNTLINQATQYVARPTVMPKTYENM